MGDESRESLIKKKGSQTEDEENDVVPLINKVAFGFGAIPDSITQTIQGFFVTPFLLEIAKIPPGNVALLLLLQRFWDAIADPFVGMLTDRTRTRWGRRRPWMFFATIPCAISYFLIWVSFDSMSTMQHTVYFALVYLVYQTSFSSYFVPYTALTMSLTHSEKQRNNLTGIRMCVNVMAQVVGITLQGFIISKMGPDNEAKAYVISALIIASLVLFSGIFAAIFSTERVDPGGAPFHPIQALKQIVRHRAYIVLTLLYLCTAACVVIIQNNFILYLKHCLGLYSIFQNVLVVLLGSALVFIAIWTKVLGYIGKKRTYLLGQVVMIGITVSLYWGTTNPIAIYFVSILAGAAVAVGLLLPWVMLPDAIDQADCEPVYKKGEARRSTAVASSRGGGGSRASHRRHASGTESVLDFPEEEEGKRKSGVRGDDVENEQDGEEEDEEEDGKHVSEGVYYSFFVFFQKVASGAAIGLSTWALDRAGYDADVDTQSDAVSNTLRLLVSFVPAGFSLLSLVFLFLYPISDDRARQIRKRLSVRRSTAALRFSTRAATPPSP